MERPRKDVLLLKDRGSVRVQKITSAFVSHSGRRKNVLTDVMTKQNTKLLRHEQQSNKEVKHN